MNSLFAGLLGGATGASSALTQQATSALAAAAAARLAAAESVDRAWIGDMQTNKANAFAEKQADAAFGRSVIQAWVNKNDQLELEGARHQNAIALEQEKERLRVAEEQRKQTLLEQQQLAGAEALAMVYGGMPLAGTGAPVGATVGAPVGAPVGGMPPAGTGAPVGAPAGGMPPAGTGAPVGGMPPAGTAPAPTGLLSPQPPTPATDTPPAAAPQTPPTDSNKFEVTDPVGVRVIVSVDTEEQFERLKAGLKDGSFTSVVPVAADAKRPQFIDLGMAPADQEPPRTSSPTSSVAKPSAPEKTKLKEPAPSYAARLGRGVKANLSNIDSAIDGPFEAYGVAADAVGWFTDEFLSAWDEKVPGGVAPTDERFLKTIPSDTRMFIDRALKEAPAPELVKPNGLIARRNEAQVQNTVRQNPTMGDIRSLPEADQMKFFKGLMALDDKTRAAVMDRLAPKSSYTYDSASGMLVDTTNGRVVPTEITALKRSENAAKTKKEFLEILKMRTDAEKRIAELVGPGIVAQLGDSAYIRRFYSESKKGVDTTEAAKVAGSDFIFWLDRNAHRLVDIGLPTEWVTFDNAQLSQALNVFVGLRGSAWEGYEAPGTLSTGTAGTGFGSGGVGNASNLSAADPDTQRKAQNIAEIARQMQQRGPGQ